MPTTTEINSMAKKVSEMKSNISNESNRLHGQVDNSSTWWQGEAGKTLRSDYNKIRTEIKTLINKMDKLYNHTISFSKKVQQAAEDKRKADAVAAAKALAAQATVEQKRLASAMKK
ncbi:WXG100 family type VII secretion target [Paenibacillus sp. DS2015]|uniref:WXG100 family type VII secretion target n=1 Tax=Paenibacillus sp. DS2015 TaxID=3373917 RepID=UPI003D205941